MRNRALFAAALFALVCLPVRAQEYQIVHDVYGAYQRITVIDTPGGYRRLIFDGKLDGSDAIQSEMNLSNREELTLPYTRRMMTALPVAGKLGRVLIVGLGGACMQRCLYKLLPDLTIETVEIEPEIRRIAAEYFYFKEDERQIVHIADGRDFIEGSRDKYDIIFLDAFGADSIPEQLKTAQFFAAAKARLAVGGVVCANLWHGASDYSETVKTYAGVFPERHILSCGHFSGNSILLALPENTGLTIKAWMEKAAAFERAHPTGLDLVRLIEDGAVRKR
jgi:spermidine synthase